MADEAERRRRLRPPITDFLLDFAGLVEVSGQRTIAEIKKV